MPLKQDLEYLGLASLRVSTMNARGELRTEDSQTWEEFKEDIKEKGILQPLLVTRARDGQEGYEVLDGARRLQALQELATNSKGELKEGTPAVPCEVVEVKEAVDQLLLSSTGNLHRLDMTPQEWAATISKLRKMGQTQAEIAKLLHKTPAWVSMVKEGKAWSEHRKSTSTPIPKAREFEDTDCPVCGNVLGVTFKDGKIELEAKGQQNAEAEAVNNAAKKKRRGKK